MAATSNDWDRVASTLLENGFYLTALELHTELLENGKEIKKLGDFFSNPGNFEAATHTTLIPPTAGEIVSRTSSVSSLDSLDLTRYSDEGEGRHDDRVAVLEFELRKAHETIKSLRTSLTRASEPNRTADESQDKNDGEPIKPHEKKVINFLLHEYLLTQSNKMTAITFCEENSDQDFDDWSDVGLNTPKPPGLLQLFRNYRKITVDHSEYIEQLQRKINSLTSQILALQRENEMLNVKLRNTEKLVRTLDLGETGDSNKPTNSQSNFSPVVPSNLVKHSRNRSLDSGTARRMMEPVPAEVNLPEEGTSSVEEKATLDVGQIPSGQDHTQDHTHSSCGDDGDIGEDVVCDEDDVITLSGDTEDLTSPDVRSRLWSSADKHMSRAFREAVLSLLNVESSEVISEITNLADNEDIVCILTRIVTNLIPQIPNKYRQNILPLLLWAASHHHDDKTRDKVLNDMFNLVKKPNRNERESLLSALVTYTKMNPQERVISELLPHCWEHISDKQFEKRVLVAECCGKLTPHVQSELRSSLLVSILSQLLIEDRVEVVRQAVVKSLTVVVALVDDETKFNQCWELLQRALSDRSQLVVGAARVWLLPAVTAWAYQLDLLDSVIVSYFLDQISVCIKQISRLEGESGATERGVQHLQNLIHLVPWQVGQVLMSMPPGEDSTSQDSHFKVTLPSPASPLLDLRVIVGSEQVLHCLVKEFERYMSQRGALWPSVMWIEEKCLPTLLKASAIVGFSQPEVVHQMCLLFSYYSLYFGQAYTESVIRPMFLSHFKVPAHNSQEAVANNKTGLTTPLVPIYACGVLASFKAMEENIEHFIKDTLITLAIYYADTTSVLSAVEELSRSRAHHPMLVNLLHELSKHPQMLVRQHVGKLIGAVGEVAEDRLVYKKVLPVLSNLASDPDVVVREGIIPVAGTLMAKTHSKEVTHQCSELFKQFVCDDMLADVHSVKLVILKTLTRVSTKVDPQFRDEFLIPHVFNMTNMSSLGHNDTQRSDIIHLLVEAYKEIVCCYVSEDLMVQFVVPGLQQLHQIVQHHSKVHEDMVSSMVKEYEEKVKHVSIPTPSDGTPPSHSRKEYFAKFLSPSRLTKSRKT